MELLSEYIYNQAPIDVYNIHEQTIANLKEEGWYDDIRQPTKFKVLNKRIKVNEQWYRIVMRFKKVGEGVYELDLPLPFAIIETNPLKQVEVQDTLHSTGRKIEINFVDQKVYHGKNVKITTGYLKEGLPVDLIDATIRDLEECVVYTHGEHKKKKDPFVPEEEENPFFVIDFDN